MWSWITQDGYKLGLSVARLARIARQLTRSGIRELVSEANQGDRPAAVRAAVGRLTRASQRRRVARSRRTGRPLWIFTSEIYGDEYALLASPRGPREASILVIRRTPAAGAEYQDSDATRIANLAIARDVVPRGTARSDWDLWTMDNQQQADANGDPIRLPVTGGKPGDYVISKPDRAYVTQLGSGSSIGLDNGANLRLLDSSIAGTGRPRNVRVNIETDINVGSAVQHQRVLNQLDQKALNISLLHDEKSGRIIGAQVSPAGSDQWFTVTGRKQLNSLVSQLPHATRKTLNHERHRPLLSKRDRAGLKRDPISVWQTAKGGAAAAAKKRARPKPKPRKTRGRKQREFEFEFETLELGLPEFEQVTPPW